MRKIVQAGAEVKSFQAAERVLKNLAEIEISGRHVQRLTAEIGRELTEKRDRETADYVHHRRTPPQVATPAGAVVAIDGGRVQTRTPDSGPGVHDRHWREDKIACLYAISGAECSEDPHPEPPRAFLNESRVDKLAKEIHAQRGTNVDWPEMPGRAKERSTSIEPDDEASPPSTWPPKRSDRRCLATMSRSEEFGKMVAAQAYACRFEAAKRKAFLADGQQCNWTIHDKWFKDYEPILDFVHVLAYLYAAATAVAASVEERWRIYVGWMTWCWRGQTHAVLEELGRHADRLGPIEPGEKVSETDPREVVRRTRVYMENNAARMDYPRYRRLGLPVNSSAVESLIKEMNYRVKGTEKFWNDPEGAEAILQVRAAMLSDDQRLEKYLASRPGSPYRYAKRPEAAVAA